MFKGYDYLLLIDYYSRYVEISKLYSTTSVTVIQHMKSIFAWHGIPGIIISDNGPQFSSDVFTKFAKDFHFQNKTSSPNFLQRNGEIEQALKTVKALLEKASDPYVSLLSYCTTPLENGYSPAELLMSRNIQSNVPMITKQYIPKLLNRSQLQVKEQNYRDGQQQRFNTCHKTYKLEPLQQGDTVWVPEFHKNATVRSEDAPQSYIIQTPTGKVRRKRRNLTLLHETNSIKNGLSDISTNFTDGYFKPFTGFTHECFIWSHTFVTNHNQHNITRDNCD